MKVYIYIYKKREDTVGMIRTQTFHCQLNKVLAPFK